MQSFNDSITNSSTYGDYGKYGDHNSSLDISNTVHSNSSLLSDDHSPGSSPGVTIHPINYVSVDVRVLYKIMQLFDFRRD